MNKPTYQKGAGPKSDFTKDAWQQLCWNHASEKGVPLSVSVFRTPYHGTVSN